LKFLQVVNWGINAADDSRAAGQLRAAVVFPHCSPSIVFSTVGKIVGGKKSGPPGTMNPAGRDGGETTGTIFTPTVVSSCNGALK